MKKRCLIWLLLLIMGVSSVGLAEKIPNVLGVWKDGSDEMVYSNKFFGFTFTYNKMLEAMFSWRHEDMNYYCPRGMSLNAWITKLYRGSELYDKNGKIAVWDVMSASNPADCKVYIRLANRNKQSLDEIITAYMEYLKKDYTVSWWGILNDMSKKKVTFLGKKQDCINLTFKKDNYVFENGKSRTEQVSYHEIVIPIIKDNLVAFVSVVSPYSKNPWYESDQYRELLNMFAPVAVTE